MIRHRSIIWKLSLGFMLVSLLSAALVALFIRYTTNDRFTNLIIDQQRSELKTTLTEYYTTNGSWQGVDTNWQLLKPDSSAPTPPPPDPALASSANTSSNDSPQNGYGPSSRERRKLFGLADANDIVIVAIEPFFLNGSTVPQHVLEKSTSIEINGQKVGTIITAPLEPRLTPEEYLYLQRTNQALIYAALAAMVIALLVGILLARTIIKPLRALTQAAQNITQGHLEQQVTVQSRDEIGQLAETFNQMSQEVARVNRLRRQMTADIAHDLRTPLTVIAGYIESMQDGVLQPTPERLAIIYDEIERLQDLVKDLRTLSLADAGELTLNPQLFAPKYLLERAIAPYQHLASQQEVTLRMEAEEDLPLIRVDEARMMQIFGNLLSNALRYTPEGGEVVLSALKHEKLIEITVKDTGEGIGDENFATYFRTILSG